MPNRIRETRLRYLLIARHGKFFINSGELSEEGRRQAEILAKKIVELRKTHLVGCDCKKTVIISSPEKRTSHSAAIISKIVEVPFKENEILSGKGNVCDIRELVIKEAEENDAEIIILVTHGEFTESFPIFFGLSELDLNPEIQLPKPDWGQAIGLDCASGEFMLLPTM